MEDTKIITMPVIALRGLTMLPEMTISFDISRKKSIAAVEKAMVGDQRVCLVAQKDPEIKDPSLDQLYHIGTVSYIKQLVKMPGGIVRVMAEGQERAELLDLDSTEPALIGEVLVYAGAGGRCGRCCSGGYVPHPEGKAGILRTPASEIQQGDPAWHDGL